MKLSISSGLHRYIFEIFVNSNDILDCMKAFPEENSYDVDDKGTSQ